MPLHIITWRKIYTRKSLQYKFYLNLQFTFVLRCLKFHRQYEEKKCTKFLAFSYTNPGVVHLITYIFFPFKSSLSQDRARLYMVDTIPSLLQLLFIALNWHSPVIKCNLNNNSMGIARPKLSESLGECVEGTLPTSQPGPASYFSVFFLSFGYF